MAASNLTYFLKSLNQKANRETENGSDVLFSLSIVSGNKSQKVLDKEPAEYMSKQVNHFVRTEKPEIIKVDLFTGEGRWIDGNVCDLRPKTPVTPTFQGFGEAEVSAMVEKRLQEMKREEEFKEMKEIVKELAGENETLKARVDELENEKDGLEEELEKKKQVKYYTGMIGDILESIGIPKERIKKPIAELMGINDEEEKQKLPPASDSSGIVENESGPADVKRAEIIGLISEYLKSVSNQILGELFTIFSEVESEPALAADILEYLKKRKEFAS